MVFTHQMSALYWCVLDGCLKTLRLSDIEHSVTRLKKERKNISYCNFQTCVCLDFTLLFRMTQKLASESIECWASRKSPANTRHQRPMRAELSCDWSIQAGQGENWPMREEYGVQRRIFEEVMCSDSMLTSWWCYNDSFVVNAASIVIIIISGTLVICTRKIYNNTQLMMIQTILYLLGMIENLANIVH